MPFSIYCLVAVMLVLQAAGLSMAPASAQQDPVLSEASKHYSAGNHKSVVETLSPAVQTSHKNSATAHYYLGNAWMSLGNRNRARQYYHRALLLNPGQSLSEYCRKAISAIDSTGTSMNVDSRKHMAASGSISKNVNASSNLTAAPSGETSKKRRSIGLSEEDKTLVSILRKTPNTEAVESQVLSGLAMMSSGLKKVLRQGGCKILITPTIVDARPDLRNEKPEGYLHGGGYDNCPGMFTPGSKTLYIAETYSRGNSPPAINHVAFAVTLHELGHAYDFVKGEPSSSSAFRKHVDEDSYKLTNTLRREYWYYTQPGNRGSSELFAELFAMANGAGIGLDERSASIPIYFPRSFKYIKDLILSEVD